MGRPRKYTAKGLRSTVDRYFDSISRTRKATEMVPTGRVDRYGHPEMEQRVILNDDGEEIKYREYVVPPTTAGLCRYLGISHQTWAEYSDKNKHPEYADSTTRARERMREYNENELLTRPGKDVRGIIFNLQNNFGYSEKREVELGQTAAQSVSAASMALDERTAMLAELLRQGVDDGDEEFVGDEG